MSAELESENARLRERLAQWEKAFETTNPSQAEAEHLAVLEKRTALQRENADLKERERVAIASWDEERQRALREGKRVVEANEKIRELMADLDEARKAPPHTEEV